MAFADDEDDPSRRARRDRSDAQRSIAHDRPIVVRLGILLACFDGTMLTLRLDEQLLWAAKAVSNRIGARRRRANRRALRRAISR